MRQPAQANHPISNSLNVMGPNPLTYPKNYSPDTEVTREAQVSKRLLFTVPMFATILSHYIMPGIQKTNFCANIKLDESKSVSQICS